MTMDPLEFRLQENIDDEQVFSVDISSYADIKLSSTQQWDQLQRKISEIESIIKENDKQLIILENEIKSFDCHADIIDYSVAASCGLLTGLVDAFWVGEFSFERAHEFGSKQVEQFVLKIAHSKGFKGDDVNKAILFLAEQVKNESGGQGYHIPGDSLTSIFGGGTKHHYRDFSHHPTPIGLIFSILTQFTGKAFGLTPKGFAWVNVTNTTYIGKNIPEKLLFGTLYWFFHIVSDIAGSGTTASGGTGLPGPLLSFFSHVSSLLFFKNIKIDDVSFAKFLENLFCGKYTNGIKIDYRTELGMINELNRQAIPVIINECLVRGFYFFRRFTDLLRRHEIKKIEDFNNIDLYEVFPFKNRTIVRMLTVATGTFTAVDLTDAAIRGALKSNGTPQGFFINFIIRINIPGLGRFVLALSQDLFMGIERETKERERMTLYSEQIDLIQAVMFYKVGQTWIMAKAASEAISTLDNYSKELCEYIQEQQELNQNSFNNMKDYISDFNKNNPGIFDDSKPRWKK